MIYLLGIRNGDPICCLPMPVDGICLNYCVSTLCGGSKQFYTISRLRSSQLKYRLGAQQISIEGVQDRELDIQHGYWVTDLLVAVVM